VRTARAERQRRSRAQADNRAHKYGNCSVTTDVRIMAQHGEAPFRAHSHEEIMDCITLGGTTVHPDKVFLHIFPPGVRAPAPRARPARRRALAPAPGARAARRLLRAMGARGGPGRMSAAHASAG